VSTLEKKSLFQQAHETHWLLLLCMALLRLLLQRFLSLHVRAISGSL